MRSKLQELKQRKLVEWALAYLASAWLLMQLIDVIGGRWPIPLGLQRSVDALLLVGFFAALTLAWYHGEKGRQRISGPELLILAALLGIAGILLSFVPSEQTAPDVERATTEVTSTDLESPGIAVLPFRNLSGNRQQDYFVAGMHEALISALSHIRGLRVISRTSVMRYADTEYSVPEIAGQLDVDTLIEGSVNTVDDRVRITVNLIDGKTDGHLWGDEYDRQLEDVLVLLSQIAQTVAARVEVSLSPEALSLLRSASSVDPDLHDLYLRGRHAFGDLSRSGVEQSIAYFEQAIALDENYAPAWAGLSGSYVLAGYLGYLPPADAMDDAERAATRALSLDSRLSIAHSALGWVRLLRFEWEIARDTFETALTYNPNDADALHGLGDYLTVTGRPEAGLEYVRMARANDPFSPVWGASVLAHLQMMRRYDALLEESDALLKVFPVTTVWAYRGGALWQLDRREEALDSFRQSSSNRPDRLAALETGYEDGGPIGALRAIAETISLQSRHSATARLNVAIWYARAGDVDQTLHWLEQALELQAPDIIYIGVRPEFELVQHEPRYQAILDRIGLETVR